MSFFSRAFRAKRKTSYVQVWTKKNLMRIKKQMSPADLFVHMIGFIVDYFDDWDESWADDEELIKASKDKAQYAKAPYSGDATTFEIACYFFFLTDMWLSENRPEHREMVGQIYFNQLVDLFIEALGIDNVPDLVDERCRKYIKFKIEEKKRRRLQFLTCGFGQSYQI